MQMSLKNVIPVVEDGQMLGLNIEESAGSVLSTVRSLANVNKDEAGEHLSGQYTYLVQALVDYTSHPDHPQDVTELLGMALDLQGLSPEAACSRTRLVVLILTCICTITFTPFAIFDMRSNLQTFNEDLRLKDCVPEYSRQNGC